MAEGSLDFEARIRLAEADLAKIRSQLRTISTEAQQQGSQLDKAFSTPLRNIAKLAGGIGAGVGLQQLTKQLINIRGEFQKLEVAFETMLGNKEQADALMQQMIQTAATTPFDLTSVSNGAKQLLAYGIAAEDVNETLIRLGDIAAGLSIPLGDLVYLYGTTRAQGRLYTQDLNQFTGRGIPMIGELAKQFGVAESEIKEMVEAGKVGFPEVQKVIESLTDEGGKFGGLMEKQSKTLSGQISNLEDSFQQMFNEIGQGTEGVLSGGISVVASLVENYEKVGKVLMSLVATYGAYKAAVIVAAAIQKSMVIAQNEAEAASIYRILTAEQQEMISKKGLSTSSAEYLVLVKAESASNMQAAKAALDKARLEVSASSKALAARRAEYVAAKQQAAQRAAELAQIKASGTAKQIETAQRKLSAAETKRETAAIAYQSAAKDFNTKKIAVETAAKTANTTMTAANTAATAANTTATRGGSVAKMMQYKWTLLVEKAQKMLNATMLKNPYVLATTAVVALAGALWSLSKAQTATERGQANFNRNVEETKKKLEDIKSRSEEYIGIIRDENATEYDRIRAYEELGKIMPSITEQYTLQELAASDASETAKEMNKSINEMEFSAVKQRMEDLRIVIARLEEQVKATQGQGVTYVANQLLGAQEQLKEEEKLYAKMVEQRKQAQWEALPIETKIAVKSFEKAELEQQFNQAKEDLQTYLDEEDAKQKANPLTYQRDVMVEFRLRSNYEYLKALYEQQQKDLTDLIASNSANGDLQSVIDKLTATEKSLKTARSNYASSGSDDDKKELEELETTYKTLTDTYKSMTDQTWVTAKQIADNRIKLEQETTKALLQQQIEQTVNKKEQLRLQYEAELAAIDQSEREFKKSNRGATSTSFDSQRQMAKTDYEIQVKVLDDEWQKFMKELQEGTTKMQEDAELEVMQRELATATDITTQLELQEKIRKRMLQQELSNIDKEESEAIKTANENGQSTEAVTAEFDKRRQTATDKSEAEGLTERLRMYEEYANKVIDIEQRKNEKIKSINQNKQLTPEQKKEQTEKVISIAEFEQANAFGGDAAEVISGDIAGIVQQIMSMSIEQLMAQIPILKSELERLKKTGANIDEIILAQTKLEAAQKALTQQTSKLGSVTDDTAEGIKKKYKEAADVLKSINDVCDSVSESFGDLLGEAGQDALSVIKTITSSVIGVITAIQSTATAAAAGVSAVEKASVILTIISLAIQAIMAIVNVMTKYFSKNAQIQKQIDAQKEKIEGFQEQYDELERTQKSQTGRKYWETQIELSKNLQEQIKELDEAILLAQEQVDSAATQKKKEEAEEQLDELEEERYDAVDKKRETLQEFYDELATTDLSSFSQSLAESIVEGWENGLKGMNEAWDTAMDDLMRSMLTKQLALELEENLKGVFDTINKSFGEGDTELSESEIAAIQAEYEAAKQSAEDKAKAYEELYNSLGLGEENEEDLEGSSGGFESMSQDTADELNGRFTAIQISTASIDTKMDTIIQGNGQLLSAAQQFCANVSLIAGIADNQLNELRQINENTAVLSEMNVKLKRIEENTSRL